MEAIPVNWIRNWPKQDYSNFSKKQIRNAKRIYKELVIIKIDEHIKETGVRISTV